MLQKILGNNGYVEVIAHQDGDILLTNALADEFTHVFSHVGQNFFLILFAWQQLDGNLAFLWLAIWYLLGYVGIGLL